MSEHTCTGWLLDLYSTAGPAVDPARALTLWLLTDEGERLQLHQPFPVTFYAASPAGAAQGASSRLRALWRALDNQPIPLTLARIRRVDLFEGPVTVLAAEILRPADQPRLFRQISRQFLELTYYDADLPLALRYAAAYGVFPLARCRVTATAGGQVQTIVPLDSPWDLDPDWPPLRILHLEPDVNPAHARPRYLHLRFEPPAWRLSRPRRYRLALEPARPLLASLRAILLRHDPDLLLTAWGDTWLLPRLLEASQSWHIPLPLNRDPDRAVEYHRELSYHSYGQIVYRGRQVHLFGRWHVDRQNAMLFHDYGLEGALETARVTGLPVQTAARVSPGSGISAMQIVTALRRGVLVPWHKQQVERPKTAAQLIHADRGGLVYQPITGLHRNVAGIDFISMYPGIMVAFNLSPETVGVRAPAASVVPGLGIPVDRTRPGLVPETLAPLLAKRVALKQRLASLPKWHPLRKLYRARSSAEKWLLVTCFGYLGYKNARFGRIEAHEAVTAYGREALLRAKEAAEAHGFTVLHMYVDGLWVQKEGGDLPALLEAIATRTGLPIALEGVYHWVAFLPSRVDARVPVANRYFGLFQDGRVKMRGIEARRRDTPPFIKQIQVALIAGIPPDPDQLGARLPRMVAFLRQKLTDLRRGRLPLEALIVAQKLSRTLEAYRVPSPAARAASQLEAVGKPVQPGQRVRFLYTRGEPGVVAWDLPGTVNPAMVDVARYAELLARAAATVFQPFGVEEAVLRDWLFGGAGYAGPPGKLVNGRPGELPLLAALNNL